MSTKIVNSGQSSPQDGAINQGDLAKIISDFENFVQLSSTDGRVITKIDYISIPLAVMYGFIQDAQKLIAANGDIGALTPADFKRININVRFGVTLPSQKDCQNPKKDISNHLTTALLIEKDGVELSSIGDSVIIPGFKANYRYPGNDNIGDTACCPSPPYH